MIKELKHSSRVVDSQQPLAFLSAPKRKRDEICASSRQSACTLDTDDDFVYPLHKRTSSSTRLPAFCSASYDSEKRDGPASDGDDDVSDDETDALVKKYRTSLFRQETLPRSNCFLSSPPLRHDEDEDNHGDFFELPSIARATTICDDSDNSTCYADPPEMYASSISSRPTSPQEEIIQEDLNLECYSHEDVEKDAIEQERERPAWLASVSASPTSTSSSFVGESKQPSPLWPMSSSSTTTMNGTSSFWKAGWSGFHQGSS